MTEHEADRARISADVDDYLSRGGIIHKVDYTANKGFSVVYKTNGKGSPVEQGYNPAQWVRNGTAPRETK